MDNSSVNLIILPQEVNRVPPGLNNSSPDWSIPQDINITVIRSHFPGRWRRLELGKLDYGPDNGVNEEATFIGILITRPVHTYSRFIRIFPAALGTSRED